MREPLVEHRLPPGAADVIRQSGDVRSKHRRLRLRRPRWEQQQQQTGDEDGGAEVHSQSAAAIVSLN